MTPSYLHDSPEQLDAERWRTSCHYTDERNRMWRVQVDWYPHQGRLEPQRVDVAGLGQPVRAEYLRRLPLATILTEMLRHAEDAFKRWSQVPDWGEGPPDGSAYADAAVVFGVQRGRRLPQSLLEQVAEVYRQAWALPGRSVTTAVAEATGCSESMASKRIMAARNAGLLEGIGPKR